MRVRNPSTAVPVLLAWQNEKESGEDNMIALYYIGRFTNMRSNNENFIFEPRRFVGEFPDQDAIDRVVQQQPEGYTYQPEPA